MGVETPSLRVEPAADDGGVDGEVASQLPQFHLPLDRDRRANGTNHRRPPQRQEVVSILDDCRTRHRPATSRDPFRGATISILLAGACIAIPGPFERITYHNDALARPARSHQ